MNTDQDNDDTRRDQWDRGLALLRSGDYWEAHEAWEDVWLSYPVESAARRATKALIQFAAICYKPEQAAAGRIEKSMQRGMGRLLETATKHLADSSQLDVPAPHWDLDALEEALEKLTGVHEQWCRGLDLDEVRASVDAIVASFEP